MSNKLRYCLLCKRYDRRLRRTSYTRISTVEREEKLREGYRQRYNGEELNQPLLNQTVHKKCYDEIVQYLPSINETTSSNDISISIEQPEDNDNDEEQNKTPIVQSRSCVSIPPNIRRFLERSKRSCFVCNRYKYSSSNRMTQIISNRTAEKLAAGYLHRYKRPYGKPLLDAYVHDLCQRKLYASYRYLSSARRLHRYQVPYQQQFINQSMESPHETRSRSNPNRSSSKSNEVTTDETTNLSVEQLFSEPFSMSTETLNPNIELSARSCLFRPCMQRLTPEEIEFYTKRNSTSIISASATDDPMIYSSQDKDAIDDVNENEEVPCLSLSILNLPSKIYTTAEIRYPSFKPPPAPLAKTTNPLLSDHIYTPTIHVKPPPDDLENLHQWLIEQLKLTGNPIPMTEVLTEYRKITKQTIILTKRESFRRASLRHRLEKFYPNEFTFVVPNKHDGTYIALNDIDYYVRMAIKNAQKEKDKATEASMVSSVIAPPTPEDYKRETCEAIMNGIRKIRLYMRDSKQINSTPSSLMQNLIGLITTSEKQFEKISHHYDFYRMIDENLFDNIYQPKSNKLDRNLRNMSLAGDLISARHDNHLSQKHYLLADEIAKETFRCTPIQVITLLNRYGHTCSYRSYRRLKTLGQQIINEIGEECMTDEEKSSDTELDLMELDIVLK